MADFIVMAIGGFLASRVIGGLGWLVGAMLGCFVYAVLFALTH